MQPGLGIIILPRKAQVVRDGFDLNACFAKRGVARRPDHRATPIHQLLRRPQAIVPIPVLFAVFFEPQRTLPQVESGL